MHPTTAARVGCCTLLWACAGGPDPGETGAAAAAPWVDLDEDGSAADSDCDDADNSVRPGARERCHDAVDNDCDGAVDARDPDCQSRRGQSASAKTPASSPSLSANSE